MWFTLFGWKYFAEKFLTMISYAHLGDQKEDYPLFGMDTAFPRFLFQTEPFWVICDRSVGM